MTPTQLTSVDIAGAERERESPVKRLNIRSFQLTPWLSSDVDCRLRQQLMEATVLAESSL